MSFWPFASSTQPNGSKLHVGEPVEPGALHVLAEGKQHGAYNHKASIPPLVGYGLDPDARFSFSSFLQWTTAATPLEVLPTLGDDLWYAASMVMDNLKERRRASIGAIKELKRRWAPVSKHLVTFQSEAIRFGFAGALRRPYSVRRLRPPSRFHQESPRGGLCPSLRSLSSPARRGDRPFRRAGWLEGAQRRRHRGRAAGFHRRFRPQAAH